MKTIKYIVVVKLDCFCKVISSLRFHFDIKVLNYSSLNRETKQEAKSYLSFRDLMCFVALQIFLKCCAVASSPNCIKPEIYAEAIQTEVSGCKTVLLAKHQQN